jgi:KUP system potassium uptake protein
MSSDAASAQPSHPHPEPEGHGHGPQIRNRADLAKLAVAALGVVYGDIGTSPLYAVKECFAQPHGVAVTPTNVLGILSLVFWSLLLVIVVKYLTFIMRADNHGEGGILSLLALVSDRPDLAKRNTTRYTALIMIGLFGAALLYGDGIITPAISVLSAVEGLEVATTAVKPFIVPITVGILVALFMMQRYGTAKVGAVFGPATLLWFVSIAAAGLPWILRRPDVLSAVNPVHAVHFFAANHWHGFLVLGSVVLCITGGEALYADMGHFGRLPIRIAWYSVVMPALLLNYFGQGAMLLERGAAGATNPFFALVPSFLIYPMVAVATVATVVASQALISGAYSLTQQAVQLGYCPRVTIVHTSGEAEGQIYIPEVNSILMVSCVALVLAFQESTKLAAAYGIAVTGTMAITSVLFYVVARSRWGWSQAKAGMLVGLFLTLDLAYFAANATKIAAGGWFPLVVAAAIFAALTTWKKGRASLGRHIIASTLPLDLFLADVKETKPPRVRGTAVFMTSNPDGAPPVLLHHFKHNKVLHEQVIMLSVMTEHVPEVPLAKRFTITKREEGFWQVIARFGFMETPNVMDVLRRCGERGITLNEADTSYYLGRETLLTSGRGEMAQWRKALFVFLSRNARPANMFFQIPPNRVVELGTQIEL